MTRGRNSTTPEGGHRLSAQASGRRERRRFETRERIFRSALTLFAERGFLRTSIADITEAADVGKGTFFNYFASKEHVLGVLAEIQLTKVAGAVEEARSGEVPVREILRRLFHQLVEEPGRSRQLTRGLLPAIIGADDVRRQAAETLTQGKSLLVGIFKLAQRRGEIGRKSSALEHALAMQQAVLGALALWAIYEEGDLHQWLDNGFERFWSAIAVKTVPSGGNF